MFWLNRADLQQLGGSGGERFAQFVDRLIRAEAARGGLPQSEIATQLRVTIKDGGVDTQVKQAIPLDGSGWFSAPTYWQFKAVDMNAIDGKRGKKKTPNDLQREIRKPYSRGLIEQGYAYRFCLLGDLAPPKVEDWEEQLKNEAFNINPRAPDPRVIHGGSLLAWAERFPAVIAWLKNLRHGVLHWDAWRQNSLAVTRNYVPNPAWAEIRQSILQHVNLGAPCLGNECCLTIGGNAGVGKTRLVSETLYESLASPGLVLYAADEQEARAIAIAVANTPEQTIILVADECSAETRFYLNENLRGHNARARVICLDNAGTRLASPATQAWLSSDSLTITAEILEANFPDVPPDRRYQYAGLSRGFVRLAADMCQRDTELASGELSGLLSSVERYVRHRLREEHLPLVCLLSLFHKVGFKAEVKSDLDVLCMIANCSSQSFGDAVRVVRESPGFVVQAGRYWYVTPEIVAQVLFTEGWRRWVSDDPAAFLTKLPDHLRQHLIDRAGKLGGEEVREGLASFFRHWFDRLTARDLSDPSTTSLASAVVEARPEEYLPKLRSAIESARDGTLSEILGYAQGAAWGPRRNLVWLLERLVSFSEFFEDCEASLFHLALSETEPQISNNATSIWKDLFRVVLSGTSVPFPQRIEILKKRTWSDNLEEATLAFSGLASALENPPGHAIGTPIVAGRVRPRDWEPASTPEYLECHRIALRLCAEHIEQGDIARHALAFDLLVERLHFVLLRGLLQEVTQIFDPENMSESETRKLLNAVDRVLSSEELSGRTKATGAHARYMDSVQEWVATFRPTDFDGRLRSVCARDPWDPRFINDPSRRDDEFDELAQGIVSNPTLLQIHLDWLASNEARSTERLGFAIGKTDKDFTCGPLIFKHAIQKVAAPLLRGYVRGLVSSQRVPSDILLDHMTRLEAAHPQIAVDILCFGGDRFDALNRVVRLVDSEVVPPRFLANFAMGTGGRDLTADEVARLLPYFIRAAAIGDADSARSGIRFLAWYQMFEKRRSEQSSLKNEVVRSPVWDLMEATLPFVDSQVAYEWSGTVEQLASSETSRAADLFGRALLSENYDLQEQARENLGKLALGHPDEVMASLGKALLDENKGWRLQVDVLRDLVEKIPPRNVIDWVRTRGISAARAIARHLPRPYLSDEGQPVVPELLDTILREFDDDQVLCNFLSGVHSGEMWYGDGSQRFRQEAEQARSFVDHPNHRIREWARSEISDRTSMAEWEQRTYEERFLPS